MWQDRKSSVDLDKRQEVNKIMKKRQIENTMLHYDPLNRMAKVKKKGNAKFGEDVGQLDFSYCDGGSVHWYKYIGKLISCTY